MQVKWVGLASFGTKKIFYLYLLYDNLQCHCAVLVYTEINTSLCLGNPMVTKQRTIAAGFPRTCYYIAAFGVEHVKQAMEITCASAICCHGERTSDLEFLETSWLPALLKVPG